MTRSKKDLVEKLYQLTLAQAAVLDPEKSGDLLDLLEQRQQVIDEINIIDLEIEKLEVMSRGLAGARPEKAPAASDLEQEALSQLRREIKLRLAEARDVDDQNRRAAAALAEGIKKNLETLQAKKSTAQAYLGPAEQNSGYFIDQKK